MHEKREFIRVRAKNIIDYKILPCYKTKGTVSRDLSKGGISFISEKFIPVSSILKLEIKLQHSDRMFTVLGKVKWCRVKFDDERYELGVKFIDTDSENLKFIGRYLKGSVR